MPKSSAPLEFTFRLPLASTANPSGLHKLLALKPPLLQPEEVKLLPCPNTKSALVSVVSGVLYSRTRLLKSSAT